MIRKLSGATYITHKGYPPLRDGKYNYTIYQSRTTRITLVLVVVARWSKDLFVKFITSRALCVIVDKYVGIMP
jgi:hypothetical protein